MKLLLNKMTVVLAMSCVSVHAIASPETASSPACLLAGKHAGVKVSSVDGSVDGLMNVYVRGLNTLRGDSQPLWIVDGAVIGSCVNQNLNSFYLSGGKTINGNKLPDYSGRSYAAPVNSFRWLNPYDIESIEILKDISATALYGMAGANGVIIVKTRRPASEKSNIWLNSNVGAGLPVRSGEPFKTGILTTHDIGMNGVFGTNSFYNISGFARYDSGYVQNANSLSGGVTLVIGDWLTAIYADSIMEIAAHFDLPYVNFIGDGERLPKCRTAHPDAVGQRYLAEKIYSTCRNYL